jgi:hypothetical protein
MNQKKNQHRMNNWVVLYRSSNLQLCELLKIALENEDIEAVTINQKDSAYAFGEVKVMVPEHKLPLAEAFLHQFFSS